MRNHFGEIRVDVEYIDNVGEIIQSLKNSILEEEKVGREPLPFKATQVPLGIPLRGGRVALTRVR